MNATPFPQKAVFLGTARNSANALPGVLWNIAKLSSLFSESAFAFVENDSGDATKRILKEWCQQNKNAQLIELDGLAGREPQRTVRIAQARNALISIVRSSFSSFDYAFMIDCDNINSQPIDLEAAKKAISFLEAHADCAGVFANSEGFYYDMWALRHPTLAPGDVWEEVCDYATSHRVSDEEAFRETFQRRVLKLAADAEPIEVESAFGGLGIYKIQSLLKNKREYVGQKIKTISVDASSPPKFMAWQCCDHISFNLGLRELGQKLFVLPDLINFDAARWGFRPSAWREMLSEIRRNQACPCNSGERYKHCHGKDL